MIDGSWTVQQDEMVIEMGSGLFVWKIEDAIGRVYFGLIGYSNSCIN